MPYGLIEYILEKCTQRSASPFDHFNYLTMRIMRTFVATYLIPTSISSFDITYVSCPQKSMLKSFPLMSFS
jgi:hypothetical protein